MKKIEDRSLFELKSVAQAVVSHDDVFFVETQMREKENDYVTAIKSVNRHSKVVKNWGDNGTVNTALQMSPQKAYISFLTNDNADKKMQLAIMALDGGSAVQLTSEKDGVGQYVWSIDGKYIYFVVSQSPEKDEKENDFPKEVVIEKITYQLDGRGVIPTENTYALKKVNIETKEVSDIHTFEYLFGLSYVSKGHDFIVFNQSDSVEDEFAFSKSTPYVFDVETKQVKKLIDKKEGTYAFVASSPDEKTFVLAGHDFSYGFVTQTNFYALDVATSTVTNLTKDIDLEPGDLLVADTQQNVTGVDVSFVSDDTFVFSATEHGKVQLYTMRLDGTLTNVIDERLHITSAVYNAFDTDVALTYSTLTQPSVVGLWQTETHTLDVLYNPNEAFENETTIVTPEMYYFKGYDNWDIQAWYLKPVDVSENYPLVLYVHGGPQVAYGESFFHEMQSLAAKGYAVLMVNPRGGNGYGQKFVASILGDYGNHDYDDLMLAVDDILEKDKNIDTKNVFVTGGSYGGFMTNWIVTQTNRFTAAVTQRSISNWISFYGVSDIGFAFVENQLQNDLSNVKRLWEMSPLAHAHQAETPLLVLHGQSDLRCPLEQGQQMYNALKRNGVATKLITFPQSSHGLSREGLPNLRLARLAAITDWFTQHKI
ncbi:S9 family peptidase [Carnobacteriaceae bacterium zg-ZUI240]|nr:S9 family peptidase [Carnobacteriaceae bacterium zg-ZUI240]